MNRISPKKNPHKPDSLSILIPEQSPQNMHPKLLGQQYCVGESLPPIDLFAIKSAILLRRKLGQGCLGIYSCLLCVLLSFLIVCSHIFYFSSFICFLDFSFVFLLIQTKQVSLLCLVGSVWVQWMNSHSGATA